MSTEGQLRGDSLRRQVDRSRAYAAEHGLDLDETTSFNDIGVSAFRGKNLKQGALSRFKEAVLTKKIAAGSYLLVESLDRFSRDEVVNAQSEFLALINAGIVVVTLIDGRVFKPGQINMMDLILSLVTLARANDESKHKSDRLSQSWANKRANVSRRKMTAMCPAWLRLSADKTKFEVIEERAAVVRSIFEDSANGIGNYKITQRLNKAGVPHFGQTTKSGQPYKKQSTGWHGSYIAKIVNNPAVCGEFQPHKYDPRGQRVADGVAIPDYYPKIVEKELFLRAKQSRSSRDFRDQYAAKGRKGEFNSNLFSGLAKCAYCGGAMRYENKGSGPKGGIFLVCDKVKRGMGCANVRWRYEDFEASFLFFVQELDLQSLLLKDDRQNQIAVGIQVLQGRLTILREQQEKTYRLHLESTSSGSFVARKLAEIDEQIGEIEAEIKRATAAQATVKAEVGRFTESRDQIKTLIDRLQNTGDEEVYELRARVASSLHALVSGIRIAGAGSRHLPQPRSAQGKKRVTSFKTPEGKVISFDQSVSKIDQTDWRFFEVRLKDGTRRIVKPGAKDPLFLRAQTATGRGGSKGVEFWLTQREP
jgi:DNA invertase Pin-like site-specific DNA recombinase